GDWTPTSAVFEVVEGDFYGRRAQKDGPSIAPPLAFIPRGLDNSSGGQVVARSEAWGPLGNQLYHFSFGAGTWMMILRDEQEGKRTQGAVVPLPGDFESGAHRGRFHPVDGQLYVTGADGWGNYAITDGDFVRIRYSGEDVHLPIGFEAWGNGLVIEFATSLDPDSLDPRHFFAQQWDYQYSGAYGSLEWSLRNPAMPGHDPVEIASVHQIDDEGKRIFVEMPDLVPSMQMQLYGRLQSREGVPFAVDLYPTLLSLRDNFTAFPGYKPSSGEKPKDLTLRVKWPVPFTPKVPRGKKGRTVNVNAVAGLQYDEKTLHASPGESLSIHFKNEDSIPHNWVLGKRDSYQTIGEASNLMMANPNADQLHYVPDLDEVLHFTPMLERNERYTLHIEAPAEPGTYPYLCTFPGHWLIMKGELIVE
ncbi:MAG: plastocyanin/azurin family copper-binding protein, partial [Verrucomicrobiota bacterium]